MTTIATRTADDPTLLIIDTETTGLIAEQDHVICELCLLAPNQNFTEAKVGKWFFELTDEEIARGSQEAFKVNNYFDRLEEEQQGLNFVTIKDRVRVAQTILLWTEDAVLAGDNVQFDALFLKHWLWRRQLKENWNYHLLDIEAMTVGIMGGDSPYPWNSKSVAEAIGVPFPDKMDRHTAFGDAYWNLLRFRKMLRMYEQGQRPKLQVVK